MTWARSRFLSLRTVLFLVILLGVTGVTVLGPVAVSTHAQSEDATKAPGAALPPDHPIVTDGPYAIADVVEKVSPAIVLIEVTYRQPERRTPTFPFGGPFGFSEEWFWPFPQPSPRGGFGSGFIIDEEGLVLTNQHLFAQPELIEKITVTLPGSKEPLEATLIGSDFDLDLAVLKIQSDQTFPVVAMGDSDQARVGEWVIAIGNPYGFQHTVTVGVLSATGREIQVNDRDQGRVRRYRNLMQTDAAINPGNSGGPLLNLKGEVIGINTAVRANAQGIGFAIPINEARKVLDDLIHKGMVVRPFIGIRYLSVDASVVSQLDLPVDYGVLIVEVLPQTAAERAGLRVYDVVTRVGRTEIRNTEDFLKAIEGMKVGDVLLLTVIRDGREVVVRVEVGERPPGL